MFCYQPSLEIKIGKCKRCWKLDEPERKAIKKRINDVVALNPSVLPFYCWKFSRDTGQSSSAGSEPNAVTVEGLGSELKHKTVENTAQSRQEEGRRKHREECGSGKEKENESGRRCIESNSRETREETSEGTYCLAFPFCNLWTEGNLVNVEKRQRVFLWLLPVHVQTRFLLSFVSEHFHSPKWQ